MIASVFLFFMVGALTAAQRDNRENRRTGIDLRRSALVRKNDAVSPRNYICCVCNEKFESTLSANIPCGHPCCFNCFIDMVPADKKCNICHQNIHRTSTNE